MTATGSSAGVRRHRPTTACTACRSRRIKCDRVQPACSHCKMRNRTCKYVQGAPPTMNIVTDPYILSIEKQLSPASETWDSVFRNQEDLVKKSQWTGSTRGTHVSLWRLAEAEETHEAYSSKPFTPSIFPSCIRLSALGDGFASAPESKLPPQEICQPFFECFQATIHPVIPVCHVPTLAREYLEFWLHLSPDTPVDSLLLILAVLYTGAANSTSAADITHSSSFLTLYEEILRIIDFTRYYVISSSVKILQAFIIVNTYQASKVSPFLAYGFLPQTIRYAQQLKLHVDPREGTTVEREVRRRLWWHLVFLDVEASIASGLPGILRSDGYTTHLPSIVYDHAIPEGTLEPAVPQKSVSPMMVALLGHWQCAQRMQIWTEQLPGREEAEDFKHVIWQLLDLIDSSAENDWPRTYLEMQVDRLYCMFGLNFWQLEQFKGTSCHSEVVRTSRSFLQHYLRLSTMPVAAGLFWVVPGFIQPLHAMAILLLHLSQCSHVDEEEKLSKDLLDMIFTLRVNHIRKGMRTGTGILGELLKGYQKPPRANNPRYRTLTNLKRHVWQKFDWFCPTFGPHQEGHELQTQMAPTVHGNPTISPPNNAQPQYGGENKGGPMVSGLENGFMYDPVDLLQRDEWDSLMGGFFLD